MYKLFSIILFMQSISNIINILIPFQGFYLFFVILILAVDSFQQDGGEIMHDIADLIFSIMASVIAYYICKWLDGDN